MKAEGGAGLDGGGFPETRENASVGRVVVLRLEGGGAHPAGDVLAREEPLEIRLEHGPEGARTAQSLSITMRTPGDDLALAVGFLFSEGILRDAADVSELGHCGPAVAGEATSNIVKICLRPDAPLDLARLQRHFYTSSSCGVCGKSSLAALRQETRFPVAPGPTVEPATLFRLPETLRRAQGLFDATGGLHGAGLFSPEGELLDLAEDVGRHNAVDKLLGRSFRRGALPWRDRILVLSGRASFELLQKAAMAAVPVVAAVGAPSSLAVELAHEAGITLVGFLRGARGNVYCHPERIGRDFGGAP